jgi:hypothetical protein
VLLLPYETVYQFTCTELAVPDNSEVYVSLQDFESIVWSLLNVKPSGPSNLESAPRFLLNLWPLTNIIEISSRK